MVAPIDLQLVLILGLCSIFPLIAWSSQRSAKHSHDPPSQRHPWHQRVQAGHWGLSSHLWPSWGEAVRLIDFKSQLECTLSSISSWNKITDNNQLPSWQPGNCAIDINSTSTFGSLLFRVTSKATKGKMPIFTRCWPSTGTRLMHIVIVDGNEILKMNCKVSGTHCINVISDWLAIKSCQINNSRIWIETLITKIKEVSQHYCQHRNQYKVKVSNSYYFS